MSISKETAKDFLPLLQALADGKTIQINLSKDNWTDIKHVAFSEPLERYRIKPEPVIVNKFMNIYNDRNMSFMYDTIDLCDNNVDNRFTRVAVMHFTFEDGELVFSQITEVK